MWDFSSNCKEIQTYLKIVMKSINVSVFSINRCWPTIGSGEIELLTLGLWQQKTHWTMALGRRTLLLSLGVGIGVGSCSTVSCLERTCGTLLAIFWVCIPCPECQAGKEETKEEYASFLGLWRVALMLFVLQWSDAPGLRHPVGPAEDSTLWCLWSGWVWCSHWFSRRLLW